MQHLVPDIGPFSAVPALSNMQHMRSFRSNRQTFLAAAVLAIVALLSAACSSQPPSLAITHPSAELSPMFFGVASVFMTIGNEGGKDVLTGASVDVPGAVVELHDIKDRRMIKITKMSIPGHEQTEMIPGGPHLMIFNMPKTLGAGNQVVLTLHFKLSGERQVPVRLERPAAVPADGS